MARLLERLTGVLRDRLRDYFELDATAPDSGRRKAQKILDELRTELGRALADQHVLSRESPVEKSLNYDEEAEQAIALGRDDLAKILLAQKIQEARLGDTEKARLDNLAARIGALEAAIRDLDDAQSEAAINDELHALDALLHETKKALQAEQ